MKILVTGGAGFIGSHLVDALVADGHDACACSTRSTRRCTAPTRTGRRMRTPKAEYRRGDVRDPRGGGAARSTASRCVFHQAAAVGVGAVDVRDRGATSRRTRSAPASCCRRSSRARRRSSGWSWRRRCRSTARARTLDADGKPASPGLRPDAQLEKREWELRDERGRALRPLGTPETKPLQPTSVYAVTKRDHEELFLAVGNAYRIPTVALRYFNVYGSRQALSNPYTGVAAIFSSRLLNGKPPLVTEDGLQSRDFVHVSDIVRANLAGAALRGGGRPRVQRGHRAADDDPRASPSCSPRGSALDDRARDHRALPRRRHPPLLRRPELRARTLGFEAEGAARGRHRRGDRVRARAEAARRGRRAPSASSSSGGSRVEGVAGTRVRRSMTGFGRADGADGLARRGAQRELAPPRGARRGCRASWRRSSARCAPSRRATSSAARSRSPCGCRARARSRRKLEIDLEAARALRARGAASWRRDLAPRRGAPGRRAAGAARRRAHARARARGRVARGRRCSPTVERACAAAAAMRAREGEALARELRGAARRDRGAGRRDRGARSAWCAAALRERLEKRLAALAPALEADPARLEQEIVLTSTAWTSPRRPCGCAATARSSARRWTAPGAVGRKLEFVLQEMGRETNTIGSKSADAELSRAVVELKTEQEKLREQVLNVE